MKARWGIFALIAIILIIVIGLGMPGTAQDRTEQRISDLETRVAALETQVAGQEAPALPFASPVVSGSPVASPGVLPQSGELVVDRTSSRFPVSGTAFDLLAAATPGELSVVAFGLHPSGFYAAVILRNGTDTPMGGAKVGVEARDASGNLVGAGSTTIVQPPVIDPGALATAYVSFGGAAMPADAVLTVSATPEPNLLDLYADHAGAEVTELVVTDLSIVGTLTNPGTAALSDVRLSIACFNDAGMLYALEVGITTQASIEPGGSSAFNGVLVGDTSPCASVLITGAGTVAAP